MASDGDEFAAQMQRASEELAEEDKPGSINHSDAKPKILLKSHSRGPALHATASSPVVLALHAIFESSKYDAVVFAVVVLNVAMIIIQTDCDAVNRQVPVWVDFANTVILFSFAFEVSLKLLVYHTSYFSNLINTIDFAIVFLDLGSFVLSRILTHTPTLSIMRVARLVRLGKSVRFLMLFPELGLMMSALWGTIKSLAWGGLLLMIAIVVYSILAVQLIHPVNQDVTALGIYEGCERCPRAFESVWQSMLTFFQQIMAGDSWGVVSLPISEQAPLTWLFFVLVLASLQLMILNVILAAVVDSAQQARLENLDIIARQKDAERKAYHKRLLRICAELDVDQSGTLTFEEIEDGFKIHPDFVHLMEAMDIQPDDIAFVWGILDADESGEVNYTEFAEELFKMKNKDSHTMIVFIKHTIGEIRHQVQLIWDLQSRSSKIDVSAPEEANGFSPQGALEGTHAQPTICISDLDQAVVPTIPLDFENAFKPPSAAALSGLGLQELLRKVDDKFEITNQLIRTLAVEAQSRTLGSPSLPQGHQRGSFSPSSVPAPTCLPTAHPLPWDICSVRRSHPVENVRRDFDYNDWQPGRLPG